MRSHRRRAYSLLHLITLLPMIAAVSTSAWLLADRALIVQGREQRHLQADAAMRDLVRRIERDACRATSATVRTEGDICELQLIGPQGKITYRTGSERILRTEAAPEKAPVTFTWTLPAGRMEFHLEGLGGSPRIVWTTFVLQAVPKASPLRTWRLSAGTAINQGGRP